MDDGITAVERQTNSYYDSIDWKVKCLLDDLAASRATSGPGQYGSNGRINRIESTLWIALQLNEPVSSDKYMDRIHPNITRAQLDRIMEKATNG